MNNNVSIIVGGTGQFGITLAKKLIKNNKVIITTRSILKSRKKFPKINKVKLENLKIGSKKEIKRLIKKFNPKHIYYFAGQSSPAKSFKKSKETYLSNFVGCKNFLEVINENNFNCKFINASSCDIFGNSNRKLDLSSQKIPVSPYGRSKLASYKLTKKFRENKGLSAYNAIIFNTESIYRNRSFLISKICLSAINAKKNSTKTAFGNLNISREWNWCPEQCDMLIKFLSKKPQDFILSNGKNFTASKMLKFAFDYFKLDFKEFVFFDKKYSRKRDISHIRSNYTKCLKRNNLKRKNNIFGKKLIHKLIRYYL
tara:strand:+ start:216 stop:1154 length:939 start_codon:yes stop_codon:yes gene_type:complete